MALHLLIESLRSRGSRHWAMEQEPISIVSDGLATAPPMPVTMTFHKALGCFKNVVSKSVDRSNITENVCLF